MKGELLEHGVKGFFTRDDLAQTWRPIGERVWNEDLRKTGHAVLDAYANDGTVSSLNPGSLILGLILDQATEQVYDDLEALGFKPAYDGDDIEAYWSNVTQHLEGQQQLKSNARKLLRERWEARYEIGAENPDAISFEQVSKIWVAGFEVGAQLLVRDGFLPLKSGTLANRLSHAPEISYEPRYVDWLTRARLGFGIPKSNSGAFSDRSIGVIHIIAESEDPDLHRRQLIHELIHFHLDAALDIAVELSTGHSTSQACQMGMWEADVSSDVTFYELFDPTDDTASHLFELNEGATELINYEIHQRVPALGVFATQGIYKCWLSVLQKMQADGVDMVPFMGFKVTDQTRDPATMTDRLRWFGVMANEFNRVYEQRKRWHDPNFGLPLFCRKLHELSRKSDPSATDTSAFTNLLVNNKSVVERLSGSVGPFRSQRFSDAERRRLLQPECQ